MKDTKLILIVIVLLVLSAYNKHTLICNINNNKLQIDSLRNVINNAQIQLDAQTLHFKDCAFISKEDVKMDKRGYFYYNRKIK